MQAGKILLKDKRLWNGDFEELLIPERTCDDMLLTAVSRSVWYLMEHETFLDRTVLIQKLKKLSYGKKPYLYNKKEFIPKEYQTFVDWFSSGRLFSVSGDHAVYPAEYLLLIFFFMKLLRIFYPAIRNCFWRMKK